MRDGAIVSDERKAAGGRALGAPAPAGEPTAVAPRDAGALQQHWAFTRMILSAAALALLRNKTRSLLTMLGVFIGVAALIAMIAVGQGANEAVRRQIESLGTNLFVIVPGATTTFDVPPVVGFFPSLFA